MTAGSLGSLVLEIAGRRVPYAHLEADDQTALSIWLAGATEQDLLLLLHESARRARRPRRPSSMTFHAVHDDGGDE
jgi:hypothetical protein